MWQMGDFGPTAPELTQSPAAALGGYEERAVCRQHQPARRHHKQQNRWQTIKGNRLGRSEAQAATGEFI